VIRAGAKAARLTNRDGILNEISGVVIGHTLESFIETAPVCSLALSNCYTLTPYLTKPLVAASASVLMRKASVASLHRLNSLKTSSATHHKLPIPLSSIHCPLQN
jgi:hypothetical protein